MGRDGTRKTAVQGSRLIHAAEDGLKDHSGFKRFFSKLSYD